MRKISIVSKALVVLLVITMIYTVCQIDTMKQVAFDSNKVVIDLNDL